MASSLYQEYVSRYGLDAKNNAVNIEFILKYIDSVLNVKNVDKSGSQTTMNVGASLNFDAGGGVVFVPTPTI